MKKKLFVVFLAFIAAAGVINAEDALSVVERSRNRINAGTTSTRSRMVITAGNGSVTERVMDQYSKADTDGNNRSVIIFHDPASVRGTRFLTIENPGRQSDQWIFLPGLGKTRRIASSEGSGSFMGTDFSYDDISSADRDSGLDNHRILREEMFNGKNCYVIESVPKDTNYQYSKMIQWIDKESFIPHKIELYDRRGTLVKLLEVIETRDVQGRLSPVVTKMTTLASGTSTLLNVINLKYDDPIPEGVFTTNFLETGRP